MRNSFILIILSLTTISLISCAAPALQRAPGAPVQPGSLAVPPAAAPPFAPDASTKADQAGGRAASEAINAAAADRMIVRTVNLELEEQDTEKSVNDISAIAAQYKGYVAQTNLSRDAKKRLVGTITLRIPADSLDDAMKAMKAASLKVLNERSNANDVTDQYTDLGARLKNLQATEDELRKMMDTIREKSNKAEDVLAVYRELTNIRTQIEQIKGQMNLIDRTTSLATITVQLTPHDEVQILDPETWAPNRTAAQALHNLVRALQWLADVAITLVLLILPLLIVLALPFVILVYLVRIIMHRRAKNKTATT
jgi:uncharacterized protein DUF4349